MKQKVPLLLGLALAAGAALFFAFGRSDADRRTTATAGAVRPTSPEAAAARADLAATAAVAEEDEAAPSRVAASRAPRVAPGKETIRVSSGADGDELYGRVLGGFGAGLGGAEVALEAIGETADGLIQMLGGSTDKETVTEPDGTFRVARPARWDEVRVKITARGYLDFEETQDLLEADGDQDLGVFELEPGVVLGGQVVDAAGKPVAGADVRRLEDGEEPGFRMGFDRQGVVETDAEGRFLFAHEEPGPYELLVEHADHPNGRFSGRTPPAGGEDTGLVLTLPVAATLAGRIEDFPPGREHVRVSARVTEAAPSDSDSPFSDAMAEAGFGPEGLEADVEANGAFLLKGLEAGKTYRVRAFARGGFFGRDACSDERVARAGADDVKLAWKPGGTLAFRVVDAATRAPVDDIQVRFRWESEGDGNFPDSTRTRSFEDGNVLIDELRPKAGHASLSMIVSAPGYLDLRRDGIGVNADGKVDLGTVELSQAATVRVTVLDAEGEGISGARVRLKPEGGDDDDYDEDGGAAFFSLVAKGSSKKTGSDGTCALPALPSATARLEVSHPAFADFALDAVPMPSQGVREETVRLLEGGRIVVLVVDADGLPVADVPVEHTYPAGTEAGDGQHETNRRGEVRLKNQAPGEHRFRTAEEAAIGDGEAQEAEWQSLLVLDGKEALLTLSVAARASVEGVITQSGAPLDRATVSLLQPEEEEGEELLLEFQVQIGRYTPSGFDSTDRTDRKGAYKLDEVPAGRYRLSVTHSDRALPHVVSLVVREGENHFDLDLPVTAVEGRVTGPDGDPVAEARVRAVPAGKADGDDVETNREAMAEMFGRGEGGVETDEDGRYRLLGVPAEKPFFVRVTSDEHVAASSEEVTLRTGEVRERVDVRVEAGGVLRVRVAGEVGPFTFLRATWAGEGKDQPPPRMAYVRRGEAVFRGLKPGPWRVSRQGQDDDEEEKSQTASVVAPGETLIDFAP
jgi:hypothetical protein